MIDGGEELDTINAESAYWYALSKDTPARQWWNLEPGHPAVGRALQIDPNEYAASYALAPFRVGRIDGKAMVLAAYPAPCLFTPYDEDWLRVETVIAWNPVDDTAVILGDTEAQIVGSFRDDNSLYASPREFFQTWAQRRAAYAVQRQMAEGKEWAAVPAELDLAPGCLLIGKPEAVRWSSYQIPRDLECVGLDATRVNKAILRSANLPRAFQRAA